ncbi:MAG: sugar phosphate isomerase/epimerase [Acidobacteriaceae bacterium]
MKLGVFTVLFGERSFTEMLAEVRQLGLEAIELGTGAYPGNSHCNAERLLADRQLLDKYKREVEDSGLFISALACQGNPLHPDARIAAQHQDTFEKTVLLAQQLQVPVVNLLSGCPGEPGGGNYPNWPGFAWPPEYLELWEWQWNEVAIPYWKEAARFANDHGIFKLAIEMHPGFLVYNPETALRLRAAVGETIGVNFDPSHLFWLNIDLPSAIEALAGCIFHCHAKDVSLNRRQMDVNGLLDRKPYSAIAKRSWNFRAPGWGHGAETWKQIVSALRVHGYDYVLSIEHEDPFTSAQEGLCYSVDFLQGLLLRERPGPMWWA